MTPDDTVDTEEIEKRSFTLPWSKKSLDAIFAYDGLTAFVAEIDGKIVGYSVISNVLDEAELLRIACLPQFRRTGIARSLLSECISYLEEKNAEHIFLEVRESNIPAINLYLSSGFRKAGFRKNYYKSPTENAILMRKDMKE